MTGSVSDFTTGSVVGSMAGSVAGSVAGSGVDSLGSEETSTTVVIFPDTRMLVVLSPSPFCDGITSTSVNVVVSVYGVVKASSWSAGTSCTMISVLVLFSVAGLASSTWPFTSSVINSVSTLITFSCPFSCCSFFSVDLGLTSIVLGNNEGESDLRSNRGE